jgi:type IV pilus biogenesis protein CpaD/CtpE
MKYKEALLIISTALLSACGSKDSDTTDARDLSYNVTLDVLSDQKTQRVI